jgi:hypothetical protein
MIPLGRYLRGRIKSLIYEITTNTAELFGHIVHAAAQIRNDSDIPHRPTSSLLKREKKLPETSWCTI